MGTAGGRAWLSALALVLGTGSALAAEPAPEPLALRRVMDLFPGESAPGLPQHSHPGDHVEWRGRAWFVAIGPDIGQELWTTDGTPAGTALFKDIAPGPPSSLVRLLTPVGDRLFFSAEEPATGRELWTSDGTAAGTRRVKDLRPGVYGGLVDSTRAFVPMGDGVVFVADDGLTGRELWKSDGTEAGTVPVVDLRPGTAHSFPTELTPWNGAIYFAATTDDGGSELWRTDGTAGGTWRVRDIAPGAVGSAPHAFQAQGAWLYFAASDPEHGEELWKTDGTEAGTQRVVDIAAGRADAKIQSLIPLGDALLFGAKNTNGALQLWRTDGTAAGTVTLATLPPPVTDKVKLDPVRMGSRVFFVTSDVTNLSWRENLWSTDGTPEGTVQLTRDASVISYSFTVWGDRLFFARERSPTTSELWSTDGTPEGTVARAVLPSSPTSLPAGLFFPLGDRLLFAGEDVWNGHELWSLERDAKAPAFECPGSREVPSTLFWGALLTKDLTPVLHGGEGPVTVRANLEEGSILPIGADTAVYFQAEDSQGRIAACALPMKVRDTTPPVIDACPTELTLTARSSQGAPLAYPDLIARDETSGSNVVLEVSPPGGSLLPLGTTRATVTAKDVSGNVRTCAFDVTVVDGQPPTNACKVSEVRVEAEGPQGAHARWPEPTPVDNSGLPVTVTSTHASGDLFPVGTTRVQLTSEDASGNRSQCSILVKVRDSHAPDLTCPEDVALRTPVLAGMEVDFPSATVVDSVSQVDLHYTPAPGTLLAPGLHSVQVSAVDAAGNAAVCSFHVAVEYDPTSDMRQGFGCSSGSGPAAFAGWLALLGIGWRTARRRKASA